MTRSLRISPFLLATALLLAPATACLAADGEATAHAAGFKENLPVWSFLAFIGFLVALKFLGWDSLTSGMREREANENRLIGEAEQLRNSAADQLRRQQGLMQALDERVREALAEAGRDADHTRKDILTAADRESQQARQRMELEISRIKNQSLHTIFAATADRIAEQAEQRIRSQFSPQDQQQMIDSTVGEFVARKS